MQKFISLFRNKFFLSFLAFIVWMLFFDRNDVLSQYQYQNQVNKLQEDKDFFVTQTAIVKKSLKELDSNLNTAEKFAREKYFMKKSNEDIFVIIKN
ncbi:MAG: septum formation initiator family protein [Sphingobacteriaceae bacterium]|nr:septum formation initiator family protein [Sphingobacteriaceae bacterium]